MARKNEALPCVCRRRLSLPVWNKHGGGVRHVSRVSGSNKHDKDSITTTRGYFSDAAQADPACDL
jgi:hypothetical protein